MNIFKQVWVVFLLVFITTLSLAQDKVLLLSGKELLVKPSSIKHDSLTFRYSNIKSGKEVKIKTEDVFSITEGGNAEQILYYQDTNSVNSDLSIEEMRMYIKGEQEADKFFKNRAVAIGGGIIGAGSCFVGYFGLIPPAAYIVAVGNHTPKKEKLVVSDKELLKDPNFVYGYQRKAKNKKINNAGIGSLIGFVVGFATLAVILK